MATRAFTRLRAEPSEPNGGRKGNDKRRRGNANPSVEIWVAAGSAIRPGSDERTCTQLATTFEPSRYRCEQGIKLRDTCLVDHALRLRPAGSECLVSRFVAEMGVVAAVALSLFAGPLRRPHCRRHEARLDRPFVTAEAIEDARNLGSARGPRTSAGDARTREGAW
jgi:hypothetical protein